MVFWAYHEKLHFSLIFFYHNLDANRVAIDCNSPYDEVTLPGTSITSTNYPSRYNNSEDCEVTIRFSSDQKVNITLEKFYVESHPTCVYDFLAIYDGDSTNSPIIGSKLCGKIDTEKSILSTGNVMTLHFHSDSSQTRTGFRVHSYAVGK